MFKRSLLLARTISISAVFVSILLGMTGCSAGADVLEAHSASNHAVLITSQSKASADLASAVSNTGTAESSDLGIEVYFPRAGQKPQDVLESLYESGHSTLYVMIYNITDKDIVNAMGNAKQRGVDVRVISDNASCKEKAQSSAIALLKSFGIPVKVNTHSGIMHMKVSISDDSVITTGSFNYTGAAEKENDENLIKIANKQVADKYQQEFLSMWNNESSFATI